MFHIRPYQAADHDAVWHLHKLGLQSVHADAGDGPWDDDLHHIEQVYVEPGGIFLVGLLAEQIVAMGALKPTTAQRAEIKRMRVLPEYQGQGLGAQILRALEEYAQRRGFSTLHLDTSVAQVAAQRFYQKYGFREVRRGKLLSFDCIFYEKQLAPGDGRTTPGNGTDVPLGAPAP